mgnify:FL=1
MQAHYPRNNASTLMNMTTLPAVKPPHASLDAATVGEIIQMALSDHVSFAQIRAAHGLHHDELNALMRTHLAPGRYRAWRKRVRKFGERRENYK